MNAKACPWIILLLPCALTAVLTGCTVTDGAVMGSVLGAGAGAVAGHQSGRAGEGAAIGALAGGLVGALTADAMQQRESDAYAAGYEHGRRDATEISSREVRMWREESRRVCRERYVVRERCCRCAPRCAPIIVQPHFGYSYWHYRCR